MPVTADPFRSRSQAKLVLVADVVLFGLVTAGYHVPKLTANACYWPVVLLAAVVLVPMAVVECNLALDRIRRVPRSWKLWVALVTGAAFPAIGAAVLGFVIHTAGSMARLWRSDSTVAVYFTVVSAVVVFSLSLLTAADDRLPAHRRARGMCPHCGYDLRAQLALATRSAGATVPAGAARAVTCPECGNSPEDAVARD